jgi:hypothetical protein
MPDKGLVRCIAREVFGLSVRLLGLYVGYLSGFAFVVDVFGEYRHASIIVSSIAGLVTGVLLVGKAEGLCNWSYRESGAASSAA